MSSDREARVTFYWVCESSIFHSSSITLNTDIIYIYVLLLLMCVLATNATHKDFNKPTDSRMVAMPIAAS